MGVVKVGAPSAGGVDTSLIELLSNPETTSAMLNEFASTYSGKMAICNLNVLPNDVIRFDGVMAKIAAAPVFLEVMYSNVSFSRSIIDNFDGATNILLADLDSARSFAKSDTNKNMIANGDIGQVVAIKNYHTAIAENLDIIDRIFNGAGTLRSQIFNIGGKDAVDALVRENETCRNHLRNKYSKTIYGTYSWVSDGGHAIALEFYGQSSYGGSVQMANFMGDYRTGTQNVGTLNTTIQRVDERVTRAQIRHVNDSVQSIRVYLRFISMS